MDAETLFRAAFTSEVTASLVTALGRAYDTACEHHVPDEGADEQSFGFNLYKYAVHQLCGVISADGGMELKTRRPSFRFLVGSYTVACHRIGASEHEDVESCFPNNDGAAGEMVERQLWLGGVDKVEGVEKARKLILGHVGNPDEGLRSIYLCVPGKVKDGKIIEWQFTLQLWTASNAAANSNAVASVEHIAAPIVHLRPEMAPIEEIVAPSVEPLTEDEDEENG